MRYGPGSTRTVLSLWISGHWSGTKGSASRSASEPKSRASVFSGHSAERAEWLRETLKNLAGGLASGRIYPSGGTVGRGDAAARELFPGGIRREEKADSSGQVFGRD